MVKKREYFKQYYQEKIKPYRKNKGVAEQMKISCFMCGHFIDYKKYVEKSPSINIDIRLWKFGGRANISVMNFTKVDPKIQVFIRNMLIVKLKAMLQALNQEIELPERIIVKENYFPRVISEEITSYNEPINFTEPIQSVTEEEVKVKW